MDENLKHEERISVPIGLLISEYFLDLYETYLVVLCTKNAGLVVLKICNCLLLVMERD